MCGWIKSYRSILDWEWWGDHNTTILWVYLLHAVNYEPKSWRGVRVNPGELITSISSLAAETRLSKRSVRTSLEKLQTTGELTIKTTNKYTLVIVRKWQDFQGETTSRTTSRTTRETTTTKEVKKEEDKNKEKDIKERTPTLKEVQDYCLERKNGIDPQHFIDYYQARNWQLSKGVKVKDWRACVRTWERREKKEDASESEKTLGGQKGTWSEKYQCYLNEHGQRWYEKTKEWGTNYGEIYDKY